MMRAATLSAVLAAAGCVVAADDATTGAGLVSGWPADGQYRLIAMDCQPVSSRSNLRIDGDNAIGGNAPCNSFSARLRAKPPEMVLGPMMTTRRFCPEMATERDFLDRLKAARDILIDGDRLILTGDAGELLAFQRIAD